MTGAADKFAHDDAAYVLGALDAADAAAFEAHLSSCAACRARVAQARSTLALLAAPTGPEPLIGRLADGATSMSDIVLPDAVLPALIREVRRARGRQRGTVVAMAVAVAACLVALVIAVWPAQHAGAPHTAPQAMTPVVATPVRATAQLVTRRWGTSVDLHCRYAAGYAGDVAYELRVLDTAGTAHDAGSWQLAPGGVTDFVGGTEVPRARIREIQVTLANGQPVLRLAVH